MRARVLVSDGLVAGKAWSILTKLGITHQESSEAEANITIVDGATIGRLGVLPEHLVVLCTGKTVRDELFAEVQARGGHVIHSSRLTAETLLAALCGKERALGGMLLAGELQEELLAKPETRALLDVFLSRPSYNPSLEEIAARLGWSRTRVRATVAALVAGRLRGKRLDHLWTFLRCRTWAVLTSVGIPRTYVERYLGIVDRTNFRRACMRAGAEVPWRSSRRSELLNRTFGPSPSE